MTDEDDSAAAAVVDDEGLNVTKDQPNEICSPTIQANSEPANIPDTFNRESVHAVEVPDLAGSQSLEPEDDRIEAAAGVDNQLSDSKTVLGVAVNNSEDQHLGANTEFASAVQIAKNRPPDAEPTPAVTVNPAHSSGDDCTAMPSQPIDEAFLKMNMPWDEGIHIPTNLFVSMSENFENPDINPFAEDLMPIGEADQVSTPIASSHSESPTAESKPTEPLPSESEPDGATDDQDDNESSIIVTDNDEGNAIKYSPDHVDKHAKEEEFPKIETTSQNDRAYPKNPKRRKLAHTGQGSSLAHSAPSDGARQNDDLTPTNATPVLPTEEQMDDFLLQMKQKSMNQAKQPRAQDPPTPAAEAVQDAEHDDEQARNFKKIQRAALRKKLAGTLSVHDEINLMKMEAEEKRRLLLLLQNHEDDEDDDDLSDDIDDIAEEEEQGEDSLFIPSASGQLEHQATQHLGKRKAGSTQIGAGSAKPQKNKRGKAQPPGKRRLPDNRKAVAVRKSTQKKLAKKKLADRQRAANLFNTHSLGYQNLFHDVQTNTASAVQPSFTATNKPEAYKELVTSIAEEARDTAKIDIAQIDLASKKFSGKGSCMPRDGEWYVKGMVSLLTHYQMLGVSFMREREMEAFEPGDESKKRLVSTEQPPGGLHADAMGLGKTVMAIANIVNDRYRRKARTNLKPTLIVAPSSILGQWKEECEKHADESVLGRVTIYRAGQDANEPPRFPLNYGVVLASFNQVARSYPKKDPPVTLQTEAERAEWWQKHFDEKKGFLHSIEWRRVILDEATAIKNHSSITALACAALKSRFRWALTGTPAMNNLGEFYSYFRFLKVKHTSSFEHFKKNFMTEEKNGSTGKERLIAILRPFMLRRTHKNSLLGAKLLDLPEPSRHTHECVFSELHRKLYIVLRTRFIEKINLMSRNGDLRKQYSCVLTLLLRLRQFVGHPLLIQDTLRDVLEDEDFIKMEQIFEESTEPADSPEGFLISHLRRQMINLERLPCVRPNPSTGNPEENDNEQGKAKDSDEAEAKDKNKDKAKQNAESEGADHVDDHVLVGASMDDVGKSFGLKNNSMEYLQSLRDAVRNSAVCDEKRCVRCGKAPSPVVMTSCGHVYCYPCTLRDTEEHIACENPGNQCHYCNSYYSTSQKYEAESGISKPTDKSQQKRDPPAPQQKSNIGEMINTWIDKDGFMLPSAKTLAFKSQMLNWLAEDPDCKVIVYTQFMAMSMILSKICDIEGWKYVTYNGQLSPKRRGATVRKFYSDPSTRLMIASLRCGGLGLNLTIATRVLIIDPWWNAAVEEQAFCRTYRRGQDKHTRMMRLVVKDTVDEHMMMLQSRKATEIEAVMADEPRNKTLPLKDLLSLFGPVEHDEEGNEFVYNDGVPSTAPPAPSDNPRHRG